MQGLSMPFLGGDAGGGWASLPCQVSWPCSSAGCSVCMLLLLHEWQHQLPRHHLQHHGDNNVNSNLSSGDCFALEKYAQHLEGAT